MVDYLLEQSIKEKKNCIMKESQITEAHMFCGLFINVCALKKKKVTKFAHLPSRRHLINTSGFIVLFRFHNFQVIPLPVLKNGTRILMFC